MTSFDRFTGIDNVTPVERLTSQQLREALNVDIDDTGRISRRKGYSQVNAGAAHSLWAHGDYCFFVRDGSLMRFHIGDGTSVVVSGIHPSAVVSYTAVNEEIYWTNGYQKGRIVNGINHAWGVPTPAGPPTLTGVAGSFPAGKYQVCCTFVDNEGREGAAGRSGAITLTAPGGIHISAVPGLSVTGTAKIYITPADGDHFYYAGTISLASPTLVVSGGHYTVPLRTQFKSEPPVGQLVRYNDGRLWVADGHVLWYSEPLNYHLFDFKQNFFMFAAPVDLLEPVLDGWYIASDQTYFLHGSNPREMEQVDIADYGAIRHTSLVLEGALLGGDNFRGPTAMWTSPQGICVGGSGGIFRNLTQNRIALDEASTGAALLREQDGIRHYISLLKSQSSDQNAFAARDIAVAEVRKNGITQ